MMSSSTSTSSVTTQRPWDGAWPLHRVQDLVMSWRTPWTSFASTIIGVVLCPGRVQVEMRRVLGELRRACLGKRSTVAMASTSSLPRSPLAMATDSSSCRMHIRRSASYNGPHFMREMQLPLCNSPFIEGRCVTPGPILNLTHDGPCACYEIIVEDWVSS